MIGRRIFVAASWVALLLLRRQAHAGHPGQGAELEQQGVCTIIEKEEFAVKKTNAYNEQWNLYSSAGFVRRRYVTTCEPSWF